MKRTRKLAMAIAVAFVTLGLVAPSFAEPPGPNDNPCPGNSKHAGKPGGGACPQP